MFLVSFFSSASNAHALTDSRSFLPAAITVPLPVTEPYDAARAHAQIKPRSPGPHAGYDRALLVVLGLPLLSVVRPRDVVSRDVLSEKQ